MEIEILNYLRVSYEDMILVFISTLLIVFIAKKYFWVHVVNYVQKREDFIINELKEANDKLAESEEINQQAKAKLKEINTKANEIIEDSKSQALLKAKEIEEASRIEVASIKEKAMKDIDNQRAKSLEEMKSEIGEIAILAANKIVKKEINKETHQDYIDEFIEKAIEA